MEQLVEQELRENDFDEKEKFEREQIAANVCLPNE